MLRKATVLIILIISSLSFVYTDPNDDLFKAIANNDLNGVKSALKNNADINNKNLLMYTPLMYACLKNNIEIVEFLIDKGADINAISLSGSALIYSCNNGFNDIVKLLISKGADVNLTTKDGYTALMSACEKGHIEIVKLLISKGADINAKAKFGKTALMSSCEKGYLEIVKLLISNGADVNIKNDGYTPLMIACSNGSIEIVKSLISKGADVNVIKYTTNDTITAISLAKEKKYKDIVNLLKKYGAKE